MNRNSDVINEDIVVEVDKRKLDEREYCELSDFYKIFGDSTRIKIIWALDQNELCVGDIAYLLEMTKSAISHQIRILRMANLVTSRRKGKEIYYSLADDHIHTIFEMGLEHIRED